MWYRKGWFCYQSQCWVQAMLLDAIQIIFFHGKLFGFEEWPPHTSQNLCGFYVSFYLFFAEQWLFFWPTCFPLVFSVFGLQCLLHWALTCKDHHWTKAQYGNVNMVLPCAIVFSYMLKSPSEENLETTLYRLIECSQVCGRNEESTTWRHVLKKNCCYDSIFVIWLFSPCAVFLLFINISDGLWRATAITS